MKKLTISRSLTLASGLAALAIAAPAHAQFGGITFDPTQSAHAIQQIVNEEKGLASQAEQVAQGSQTNLTLIQQLTNDVKMAQTELNIYQQTITTYNTMVNNLKYFNSKQIWTTAENALLHGTVQNSYGETAGLQAQLNGQSQNASLVWKLMQLAISGTSSSFWSQEIVGNSQRLTTLAHIEAMDAASSNCLSAVSAYQSSRANNLAANNALNTSIYDTSDLTNSEVEQLNLLSMSDSQRMEEAHAQGQLHACMASQAAVENMDKRNIASVTINDANYKYTQQANNPTYLGNGSTTWTTYY
jgi:hypothetical protein